MYTICHKCAEVFDGDKCPNCNTEAIIRTTDDLNKNAYMAVRYGYQYRKIAQKYASDKNDRLHYCLGDPSKILELLADLILSGITWDIIKMGVKKLYDLIITRTKLEKETREQEAYDILNDENKLHEFYEYIIEYKEGFIHISEKEYKYIEEEMIADFVAEEMANKVDINNLDIDNMVLHYKEVTFKALQKIQKISHRQTIIK